MEDLYVGFCFFGACVSGIFIGYCLARLDYIYVVLRAWHEGASRTPQAAGFFSHADKKIAHKTQATQIVAEKIDIDTRTVVTEINTTGIQKGSEVELGTTTAKQDAINASVSRLSQLKGKK